MRKGIWILVIVIIIIIGIICAILMDQAQKTIGSPKLENVQGNEITNMQTVNKENEIEENELENRAGEDISINIPTETFDEEPKTEQEKAIQIVKKDYGNDTNIKINVEGMDENGRQIVTVRNSQTTEALAFYFVNVSEGTFTKKEMN